MGQIVWARRVLKHQNAGFRPGQKTPEEFAAALSAPGHGGFEVIFSFAELDWPYKAMAQHKREQERNANPEADRAANRTRTIENGCAETDQSRRPEIEQVQIREASTEQAFPDLRKQRAKGQSQLNVLGEDP